MDTNVRGRRHVGRQRPSRDPKHRSGSSSSRNRSIERLQREVSTIGPSSALKTRVTSPRPRRRSQSGTKSSASVRRTRILMPSASRGLRSEERMTREDCRKLSTTRQGKTVERRNGDNESRSRRGSTYNGEVACDGDRSIKSGRSFRPRLRKSKGNSGSVVEGAPFDKGGRCFKHPQVKLASKSLLGGWKIHLHNCPLCKRSQSEDDRSVFSGMTGGSSSDYSRRSVGNKSYSSAQRSMCSQGNISVASRRSMGSTATASSWVSNQSKRRLRDASFLPLDEDGYCKYHPGKWQVCAGDYGLDSLFFRRPALRDH